MIKYRAFVQVIESGSITKAAKALQYSQPGISYMIDSLEKEMGFSLLVRSKDKVTPTKDGERVLYHCKQIIKSEDDLNETVRAINGLMDGTLYIGAQNSVILSIIPKILSRFSSSFSAINMNLAELPIKEFPDQMRRGDIDVGFMSELKVKGFEFHPLFEDPMLLVVNKDHPFAQYEKIPVRNLNGCDFIMPVEGWDDTVLAVHNNYPFQANIHYHVASDAAALSLVFANQGVYIMSALQASMLPPNVTVIPFEEHYTRTMGYMVKTLKNATPALHEFIKVTEKVVSEFVNDEDNLLIPIKS